MFEYKQFGQPLALGSAIRDAVEEREFITLDEFTKAKDSIYHKGWAAVPRNVVSWAIRQVWSSHSTTGEDVLPEGNYVSMKNVEEAADSLLKKVTSSGSPFERTFTKKHFRKTYASSLAHGQKLSDRDFDVLLLFLSRDKSVLSYDGKTVRIRGVEAQHSPITEEDRAISSLKELIADLQLQTTIMEGRVEQLAEKARDAITRKNRVSALAALKSKKLLEASLAQRHVTLSQLETVAAKIQQAADHVQMVRVMEASTGVLQSLNKQTGGVEHVDEVMDKLREQIAEVDEVGDIITTGSQVIDEAEVDDELAEMERQEMIAQDLAKEETEGLRPPHEDAMEAEKTSKLLQAIPVVPSEQLSSDSIAAVAEAAETVARLSLEESAQRTEKKLPAK